MKTAISEKQHAANQANALHSTGPRTESGKAASRLNGLKHGLTGEMRLMPHEDQAEYERRSTGIIESMAPANELELRIAVSIADDYWRIDRIRNMEAFSMDQVFLNNDPAMIRQLQLFSIYEARLNRNIRNNQAEYRKLQAERRELQNEADAQAVPPCPQGAPAPTTIQANGFGFPTPSGPNTMEAPEANHIREYDPAIQKEAA